MILVTGGTGTIGQELVRILADKGATFRVMVRSAEKANALEAQNIRTVVGDLTDPMSLGPAMAECNSLFLLSPPVENQAALQLNALRAAQANAINFVVKLSAQGASPESPLKLGRDHATVETALSETGIAHTILRPGSFMQNFLGSAQSIANRGEFYGSAGEGGMAFIDTRDIAAVAAEVLTTTGYESRTYELTGSEALSYSEVAETFSRVLGTAVRYVDLPPEAFKAGLLEAGLPSWLAQDLVTLEGFIRSGHLPEISDAVSLILKRPALTFHEFARDHAEAFKSAGR